jgi:hypothetical protein
LNLLLILFCRRVGDHLRASFGQSIKPIALLIREKFPAAKIAADPKFNVTLITKMSLDKVKSVTDEVDPSEDSLGESDLEPTKPQ